jgi:hypothetical protein
MTEPRKPISEDMLQAWVDGEFSTEDSADLLVELQGDRELMKRACDMRMLKDAVRLAYQDPPEPPAGLYRSVRDSRVWRGLAAGAVLVVLGVIMGWNLRTPESTQRFVILDPTGSGRAPVTTEFSALRIVFHLTNPDMVVGGELLNDIEAMLHEHQRSGRDLRVEVVAHGDGLGLLRERLTRHRDRIENLAQEYPNLTFVACQNTIDRLRVEQGVEVVLLPDARLAESGVDHVIQRQRDGWVYIRV